MFLTKINAMSYINCWTAEQAYSIGFGNKTRLHYEYKFIEKFTPWSHHWVNDNKSRFLFPRMQSICWKHNR